ncbi:plasmid replication protein repH [Corchorus capsularis]|uniref:Plasmid replication protein repH n=1 Tax=Corchorus capsularis TaxID=210143 RepID=A0A1R3JVH8_COCAP|nr:plasmid replication protein repH [Corchorus capsularis]
MMSYQMILMLFLIKIKIYYLVDSDGYGTPGSPCLSVHSRSTDEINMILEEEANYREVSVEFGNVDNVLDSGDSGKCCHMTLHEGESERLDDIFDDNESLMVANGLFPTIQSTESAIVVSDSEMNAIRMTSIDESVVALESIVDHTLKKPRRRKKRKNHYWSRKKSHVKANHAMVVYNGPPEINEIDNHISDDDIAHRNNVLRNEARKVLEVGKIVRYIIC